MHKYIFFFFLTFPYLMNAQVDTTDIDLEIAAFVTLDSFVVTATRQGFNVEDFVQLVREDESFYAAFRNIRFLSYSSSNTMSLYDKKGNTKATYQSEVAQRSDGKCRSMDFLEEEFTGNFYKKKKKHRYYTGKLHDRLFLTHGEQCGDPLVDINAIKAESRMEKYVGELKKLIFKPGEEADVPLIGKKTAIFDKKMMRFYDFSIHSEQYKSGADCYVFTATVKPEFQHKDGKTVIKYLRTFFEKESFQVIARDYQLAYATALYDFDVTMKIELGKVGKQYVPTTIKYNGRWDVPARKPEIAQFDIRFWDYQ